jgi:hypothetical protein
MPLAIINSLAGRPSRASAAAIGHEFVLNGAPPRLAVRGLDALSEMVCDWTVAILEEAVNDPTRAFLIRRQALLKLRDLLAGAVDRGYPHLDRSACHHLAREAMHELDDARDSDRECEGRAIEDLADHLSQAVDEGYFKELPDF